MKNQGFDFDRMIDREGSWSLKWSRSEGSGDERKLLPLWVADMDFPSPPAVVEALRERAAHPLYGYTLHPREYFDSLTRWMADRHGWNISPDWVLPAPGVVPAVSLAIRTYTRPGDRVILQSPVYHPFFSVIEGNGRRVADNPLILENGRYRMDIEGLDRVASDGRTRMLLLCSPHNPVGRVWSREELDGLLEICLRRNILVVSDEIHMDLVPPADARDGLPGGTAPTHVPTAACSERAASITITCTSPGKSFNLAGIAQGNVIISDRFLREQFKAGLGDAGIGGSGNPFAMAAQIAAYRDGERWLDAALAVIRENDRFLRRFLADRLPGVKAVPLEGTYLAWLDFRGTGRDDHEVERLLMREARVWLSPGLQFGPGGTGFRRLNLACPRSILEEALVRITEAFGSEPG